MELESRSIVRRFISRLVEESLLSWRTRLNKELLDACRDGDEGRVKDAIRKGAIFNYLPFLCLIGDPPLIIASRNGHSKIVQILIGAGANLEAKDMWGYTPLMLASANGNSETVQVLIDNGAKLEATVLGYTSLILPIMNVRPETKLEAADQKFWKDYREYLSSILRARIKDSRLLRRSSRRDHLQLCMSLSELVSLLKSLRSGWGPPLELLVRMVNSNFWVMEADLWADLLILACWSNPTIKREDVLCKVCNCVWEQPATTFCGHTFCRRCLMKSLTSSRNCPVCEEVVDPEKVMKFNQAAETLLSNYKEEQRVSDEEWDSFCASVKIHIPGKRQREIEDVSPEVKRRKLCNTPSTNGATILQVNTHLLAVKTAVWDTQPKWKDVGRALGLKESTIESIHDPNDGECLHQVLKQWMQSGHATINDLLEALDHPTVGRTDIANTIRTLTGENRVKVGLTEQV